MDTFQSEFLKKIKTVNGGIKRKDFYLAKYS